MNVLRIYYPLMYILFKKLLYLKNISKYKNKFIVLIFYNIILIKNVLYWKYVNIKNTMSYRNKK